MEKNLAVPKKLLEPGEIEIPHQEKKVLRSGEDIINNLVEESFLVGD